MNTHNTWLIADDEYKNFVYCINEDGTNRFCFSVQGGYEKQGEKQAEWRRTTLETIQQVTRLAAAAPELLESLEEIMPYIAHDKCVPWEKAQKAIDKAKAKGGTP